MEQIHIHISGLVQGVGFRFFIKSTAKQNGINGWVRNLNDTRVEAVLQGKSKQIEKVINACRNGPILAKVKEVSVIREEVVEKFNEFQILQTS